jgi:hypothetical protein
LFGRMLAGLDVRAAQRATLPSTTEIKKNTDLTIFLNRRCFHIHSQTNSLRPHRHGLLHRDRTSVPALHRARALLPTFLSSHCHSPLAAEFFEPTRCDHEDCSGAAFFTTSSCLPATILPLHYTRALLAGYRSFPPGRPWLLAAPCVCFRCVSQVVSKCFICMLHMLQVYVLSASVV